MTSLLLSHTAWQLSPFQQGLWPEATLSDAARGPNFLLELFASGVDSHLPGIWTCKAVPSYWLGTRVSSSFQQVTAWIWLITNPISIIPTDLYHRVSITIYGVPWGLCIQPIIGVGCNLDWTGRKIDQLRLLLFGAVAGYQLDGQSTAPTANAASIGAIMGPLATLTFRCAARGTVLFLMFGTKDKCEECLTNWSAGCWDVWCRGELEVECWTKMLGCS